MSQKTKPDRNQINTDVDDETFAKLKKIEENHGPKPPAIVRLALADFLPRYLSARAMLRKWSC